SYSSAVSPCRARSSAVAVMRTAILSRRAAAVRVELPEPEVHPFDVRGAVVVASDKGHELELGVAGVAQEAVGDLVQREQAVRGADHEVGWELAEGSHRSGLKLGRVVLQRPGMHAQRRPHSGLPKGDV